MTPVVWTQDLADAIRGLISDPNPDIASRAREYHRGVLPGDTLLPHQVEYTHCLLQRLGWPETTPSHTAFKQAWEKALGPQDHPAGV